GGHRAGGAGGRPARSGHGGQAYEPSACVAAARKGNTPPEPLAVPTNPPYAFAPSPERRHADEGRARRTPLAARAGGPARDRAAAAARPVRRRDPRCTRPAPATLRE